MHTGIRVYVAGPYTLGDPVLNVREAIGVADTLAESGYIPFVPHLNHLWHLTSPHEYEFWMALDFNWLRSCDALFRLPGESPGADREVKLAGELGIPVVQAVGDLLRLTEKEGDRYVLRRSDN